MSSNAKFYDYYMVEGPAVKALIDGHKAIASQRDEIIKALMAQFGAVGFIDTSGFGNKGGLVRNLAWPANFQFGQPMTIKTRSYFQDQAVVVARGKANTKEGREFNKTLDAALKEANQKLEKLPVWQAYIIDHYGVMKTGFGAAADRGFGIAMLTTYGGRCPGRDDCLLFAIPNNKGEEDIKNHGTIAIPAEFQKLTYGQFFDMTNVSAKEDDE